MTAEDARALLTVARRMEAAEEAAVMDAVATIYDRGRPDGRADGYAEWVLDAEGFALLVWHNPDVAAWLYLFYTPDTRDTLVQQAGALAERLYDGLGGSSGPGAQSGCDAGDGGDGAGGHAEDVEREFAELDRRLCDGLIEFLAA